MKHHRGNCRLAIFGALIAVVLGVCQTPSGAAPPCFDVRVEYRGRDFVKTSGGVDYYHWTYRVYGQGCINRALSHWTLQLCGVIQAQTSETSTEAIDGSDVAGGVASMYTYNFGPDPTTGVNGVKWDFASGNSLDTSGEFDEFSFVAPGDPGPIEWAAKGGPRVVSGSTTGPACGPVPVETVSWGAIKALYTN